MKPIPKPKPFQKTIFQKTLIKGRKGGASPRPLNIMLKDISIKKSKIHGKGVFAKRDFKKGEVVLKWHPKKLTKKQVNELSDNEKDCLLF